MGWSRVFGFSVVAAGSGVVGVLCRVVRVGRGRGFWICRPGFRSGRPLGCEAGCELLGEGALQVLSDGREGGRRDLLKVGCDGSERFGGCLTQRRGVQRGESVLEGGRRRGAKGVRQCLLYRREVRPWRVEQLPHSAGIRRHAGLVQQLSKELVALSGPRAIAARERRENSGNLVDVGVLGRDGVSNDSGEVAAIDAAAREVADGDRHGGHRQAVYDGPLIRGEVATMQRDLRIPGLLAAGQTELEGVGFKVAELVEVGGRTMRHHSDGRVAESLIDGEVGCQTEPGGLELGPGIDGRASQAVDAMTQSF